MAVKFNRISRSRRKLLTGATTCALIILSGTLTFAQSLQKSEILVIGDSQIAFRGGETFLDYFNKFVNNCSKLLPHRKADFDRFKDGAVGVVGVRSTSINGWVAKDGRAKDDVCEPEKSWPVNARGFGTLHHLSKSFVQVGEDPAYPLCVNGLSPLEALFDHLETRPKLLVLTFLGKTTKIWAKDAETAKRDAVALAAQVPRDTPCVFVTTAPSFRPPVNVERYQAQEHFIDALKEQKMACKPVRGLTLKTLARLENMPLFFKQDVLGFIRDPFHPNDDGIKAYLNAIEPSLCAAISKAVVDAESFNQ